MWDHKVSREGGGGGGSPAARGGAHGAARVNLPQKGILQLLSPNFSQEMYNLLRLLCWFPTNITKSCNAFYCIFSNVGTKFPFPFKEQVYSTEISYYNSSLLFENIFFKCNFKCKKAFLMGNNRFPMCFPTSHTAKLTYPGTWAECPDQMLC